MGRGRGGNEDGAVAEKEWKGGRMGVFSSLLDSLGVSPAHTLYTVRNQTCHRLGIGLCSTVVCQDYHSDSSAGCAAPLSLPSSSQTSIFFMHGCRHSQAIV